MKETNPVIVYLQKKIILHTTNHVDKYYAFPTHFCLNTCSAGDNYVHAQTLDTRLFLSPPTKSLGTRLDDIRLMAPLEIIFKMWMFRW